MGPPRPRGDGNPPRGAAAAERPRALAAGDGRQDRELGPVGDRRLEAVAEADVLAADVDVDEAPQRAVVVGDALAQLAEALEQARRAPPDGRALELDLGSPPAAARSWVGILTVTAIRRTASAPLDLVDELVDASASISYVSNVPRTASSVFRPSPVMTSTTRSSGSMSPRAASFASTAVVTPPAVSVKMPVVSASRRMPARISSSLTASIEPPLRRARSSA